MADLIKVFEKIPPLSLLHICKPEFAKYLSDHLLQHSDDLDFVQDVLSNWQKQRIESNPEFGASGFREKKAMW